MKNLLRITAALLLTGLGTAYAQQGIGTITPNDNAALEIESPDKGVLIPRISLPSSNTLFNGVTGGSSHNGMLVYNTNTVTSTGLTGEGLYQWRLPNTGGTTYYWFKLLTLEDAARVNAGTVTNSTLRWSGDAWVENDQVLTSSDQVTLTTELFVGAGNATMTINSNGMDMTTSGSITISATAITVTGPTTFTNTVTLNSNLVDGLGRSGITGEVLTATETGTQWANPNRQGVLTITAATSQPDVFFNILLIEPRNTNIDVQLRQSGPGVNQYPDGYELKIRRNWQYATGSTFTVTIWAAPGETINGQTSMNLNVGYQSVTLYNTGTGWVRIE